MEEKEMQAAEQQPESEALPPKAESETAAAPETPVEPGSAPESAPETSAEIEPSLESAPGTANDAAAESAPEAEFIVAEDFIERQEQPAGAQEVEAAELKAILEAIVYVLDEPMPAAQIAAALDRPLDEVEPMLKQLAEETARTDRGVFIREVAGGYQMATKPEHHEVIRTFVKNLKQPLKLSQAALETLAVIAYKQPITMPEILEVRGVQGGGVVKTLIDRKLVTTAGRKNVIGKPILYKTTKEFLTQFGLNELAELPTLKEFEEIRRQSMADEEILGMPEPQAAADGEPDATVLEVSAAAEIAEVETCVPEPPQIEEPQNG